MLALAAVVLCSFALSLILTPLARNFALRQGWVDRPDGGRKIHRTPIACVGGVPILISYIAAIGVVLLSPWDLGSRFGQALPIIWRLLPAVVAVFLTGLLDDVWGLKPWQKLCGQIVAALLACWAGVVVHSIAGHTFQVWWAIPLTILWLVGCSNALNLIDGVDGLAAGVALFAAVTTLASALLQSNLALALATVPLVGALLGFLRYNFNPASIFLGDCGSLTLGFLLGCYGVIWSQKAATILAITAPLMALSIPLLDTALAIVRRFLRGQPIFKADRSHIHHRLLDRGLTPRRVSLLLYAVCGAAATFSLVQTTIHAQYSGIVIVLFCAAAWVGIQHLGYAEFNLAGRLARPNTFRKILAAQLRLQSLEVSFSRAETIEECWTALRSGSLDLGFTRIEMVIGDGVYREVYDGASRAHVWRMRVPLSREEFVELGREFGAGDSVPLVAGPLAEVIRRSLAPRIAALQAESSGRDAIVAM